MMSDHLSLFMFLLGASPKGRLIEQHDLYFGIGETPQALKPQLKNHWPEAEGTLHIDAYRRVRSVNGYEVSIVKTTEASVAEHLFAFNLGGYRKGYFHEFHDVKVVVAKNMAEATRIAKQTAFFSDFHLKEAPSHIDDKYNLSIDDAYNLSELLSKSFPSFGLKLTKADIPEDETVLGYFPIDRF